MKHQNKICILKEIYKYTLLVLFKNFHTQVDINDQYLQSLQAAFPLSSSPLIKTDEVVQRIHEAVVSHYHNILRDFESTDFAKIGSVTKEDLREVMARNIMRLNDEQVTTN